jgi:hypothetical protein
MANNRVGHLSQPLRPIVIGCRTRWASVTKPSRQISITVPFVQISLRQSAQMHPSGALPLCTWESDTVPNYWAWRQSASTWQATAANRRLGSGR